MMKLIEKEKDDARCVRLSTDIALLSEDMHALKPLVSDTN